MTDSEFFYNLVIDLLEDENEAAEVAELLHWWNQCVHLLRCYNPNGDD